MRSTFCLAGSIVLSLLAFDAHADGGGDGRVIWQEVVRASEQGVSTVLASARRQARTGDVDGALALLDAVDADGVEGRILETRLQILVGAARYDEAIAIAAAAPSGARTPAVRFFAAAALARVGRLAEARDELVAATRFRSDLLDSAVYHGNLGELYLVEGDLDRAVLHYQQSLAADAGYVPARAGLSLAMVLAGRRDEALRHGLRVLMEDPQLTFINAPGVFWSLAGLGDALDANLASLGGDVARAQQALRRLEGTEAATTFPVLASAIGDRLGADSLRIDRYAMANCWPTTMALSAAGDRMAVVCSGTGILEGTISQGRFAYSTTVNTGYSSGWGNVADSVVDVVYAPDGQSLRLLHYTGVAESLTIEGSRLVPAERVEYANAQVSPRQFVGPDRVLFLSNSSSGVQVWDWAQAPLTVALTFVGSQGWLDAPFAADDGNLLISRYNGDIEVYRAPSWTLERTIDVSVANEWYGAFAASADGTQVAVPRAGSVLIYSIDTGYIDALVRVADSAGNPLSADSSTVRFAPDGRVLLGLWGEVLVIDPGGATTE